jgi:hypothetical protein
MTGLMLHKRRLFNIVKGFCKKDTVTNQEANTNTNEVTNLSSTTVIHLSDNKRLEIDNTLFKQLEKVNKLMPVENLDSKTLSDIVKYKIFEDSVAQTVNKVKSDVPEIAKHTEFTEWVKSVIDEDKQEEVLHKEGLVILKNKTDILHKYGIDIHNYKKYQDRDYEVDIQEVLTKDLFEKQRVVDSFVEANKDKINELIGYYQNRLGKIARQNKYSYLVYQNNYLDKMGLIKKSLICNIITAGFLSGALYLLNPYILILLAPEYLSILYTSYIVNNLIDQVILLEDKKTVLIRRFNLLGFRRELPIRPVYSIKDIHYKRKVKNPFLTIEKGVTFITRLLRRLLGTKPDNPKYNNFELFHNIVINSQNFYVPADLETQHADTDETLFIAIMNGDFKTTTEYDYNDFEDRLTALNESLERYNKELATKAHDNYFSEEDRLRMKYSKFLPNRDFSDTRYQYTLRRNDEIDGEYIDNGYR